MFFARKKVLAASCSLAFMLAFTPVNAGFLNDMYEDMSANANVTGAQIYESQRVGVITGGGMVWKAPVQNFQPFGFTPPRLKAGCGGIDLFMGSFSMFSKDEFIQMMRALAQNSAGVLFEVALQALSPEIASVMSKFTNMVKGANEHFGNSCEKAREVVGFLGADKFVKERAEEVRGWGVANGWWDDRAAVVKDTGADASKIRQNPTPKKNNQDQVIADHEMNITWNVLKMGDFNMLTAQDKEMVMTMLGTVITKWKVSQGGDENDPDQNLDPQLKPAKGLLNLKDWVGTSSGGGVNNVDLKIYECDDHQNCMNVTEVDRTYFPISVTIYDQLMELRNAVIERRSPVDVNGIDPRGVVALTSVPIGNIINLVTSQQYGQMSANLLSVYADAIAYDIVTRIMEEVLMQTKIAVQEYKTGGSPAAIDMVNLKEGMEQFREQLWQIRRDVHAAVNTQNTSITQYNALQQQIMGSMSKKVLNSLDFKV